MSHVSTGVWRSVQLKFYFDAWRKVLCNKVLVASITFQLDLLFFCQKNYISAFFFIYTVTALQRMCRASDHVFLSQTCTGTPLALGAVGARERFPDKK